jgi:chromosome segregation ATPase
VKFLAPGLRELARLSDRFSRRLRLVAQRRKLAHLESKLGLLGWQQAEYDSHTQQHVDRLNNVERTQAQLTNQSAELGVAIAKLEERRTSERATYDQEHAAREATRAPLVGPVQETERALSDKQRECKEIEERINALDREMRADEEKYRALLAKGDQTPDRAAEVQRLQKRVIAIPQEKREWQQRQITAQAGMAPIEAELHERRAVLAVETDALRTLEENFKRSDNALIEEIASRKREKQKLEKEVDALEKTKTHPYREIGKVLADYNIEPLNQPQALEAVLAQREVIAVQEARLAESLAQSGQEKKADVWTAWVLLLCFVILVWFAVWIVLRSR